MEVSAFPTCAETWMVVSEVRDGFGHLRHEERRGVEVPLTTIVRPDRRKVEVGTVIEVGIIHTSSYSTISSSHESAIPSIRQPHLEIDLRGRGSRDNTIDATHVHRVHLVGRETGRVGTSRDIDPRRVMSGARDHGVGNGGDGGEG